MGNYQSLGHKTLYFFIFARSAPAFVLLLIAGGAFLVFSADIPASYSILGITTINVHELARVASLGAFMLFFAALGLAILIGWLVYINYKFSVSDDGLHIKRGIFMKHEVSIPYKQIQDVGIRRDLAYIILGLSKLLIETAGDAGSAGPDSAEGVLPALDKIKAEEIRAELLRRANMERVMRVNPPQV